MCKVVWLLIAPEISGSNPDYSLAWSSLCYWKGQKQLIIGRALPMLSLKKDSPATVLLMSGFWSWWYLSSERKVDTIKQGFTKERQKRIQTFSKGLGRKILNLFIWCLYQGLNTLFVPSCVVRARKKIKKFLVKIISFAKSVRWRREIKIAFDNSSYLPIRHKTMNTGSSTGRGVRGSVTRIG